MRALDDAVRAGKVLYIGISGTRPGFVTRANTLAERRDWTSFVGLQIPYRRLKRDIERDLMRIAEHFGMTNRRLEPARQRHHVRQIHPPALVAPKGPPGCQPTRSVITPSPAS